MRVALSGAGWNIKILFALLDASPVPTAHTFAFPRRHRVEEAHLNAGKGILMETQRGALGAAAHDAVAPGDRRQARVGRAQDSGPLLSPAVAPLVLCGMRPPCQ